MRQRAIVFVESNTSGTGLIFLETAKALGLTPILLTADTLRVKTVVGDRALVLAANTSSASKLTEICFRLSERYLIEGVWSSSEYYIATAACLAELLTLPGPVASAVSLCRSKKYQRDRTLTLSERAPKVVVAEFDHLAQAAQEIGFPLVVKPVSGSGSLGVRRCNSEYELERIKKEILVDVRAHQLEELCLIEEYVEGEEYSVEIFDGRSVGVTRKYLGSLPFFVEVGHDFPAEISESKRAIVSDFAERVAGRLDLGWGPIHIEVKLADGKPILIEANPRLAGGYIPLLVQHALGIDLIKSTIERVLGRSADLQPRINRAAAIRFSTERGWPSGGLNMNVSGLPDGCSIVDVRSYGNSREAFVRRGDFRDRTGHVMAVGNLVGDARNAAEYALRWLTMDKGAKYGQGSFAV